MRHTSPHAAPHALVLGNPACPTDWHFGWCPSIDLGYDTNMYCKSDGMSIGKFLVERNVIDESPKYQRESGIWSPDKQQLFLDSLFNEFDVPKIYLHELRGKNSRYHFAIIDGKQRLHAIWRFLNGEIALAQDFDLYDKVKAKEHPIKPSSKYADLSPWWQETFKNTSLTVTFVHNADEEDIEELFSRLNNGEPLSAAEKRNAKAGEMVELIREVSKMSFFTQRVTFGNKRLQHHEVAAKFLLIELTEETTGDPFSDLKKRFLDKMVDNNRHLSSALRERLLKRVGESIKRLNRVFTKSDPLLSKQAYGPVYYLFLKVMTREYAHPDMYSRLRTFIEGFHAELRTNLEKKEEERDLSCWSLVVSCSRAQTI